MQKYEVFPDNLCFYIRTCHALYFNTFYLNFHCVDEWRWQRFLTRSRFNYCRAVDLSGAFYNRSNYVFTHRFSCPKDFQTLTVKFI